jgi:hypothetical protein
MTAVEGRERVSNLGLICDGLEKLCESAGGREPTAAFAALSHFRDVEGEDGLIALRKWCPRVCRFTFRFGRE